jgi:hypothetical protein
MTRMAGATTKVGDPVDPGPLHCVRPSSHSETKRKEVVRMRLDYERSHSL